MASWVIPRDPEAAALFGAVCGVLVAVISWFVCHRLATRRDRRREFNAIGERLIERLIAERNCSGPYARGLNPVDVELIRLRMGRRRAAFEFVLSRYYESKSEDNQEADDRGQVRYEHPEIVQDAIDDLLPYLHRK